MTSDLKQANDAFGQGIVVTVPDASDGQDFVSIRQPFGVFDRQVLTAPVTPDGSIHSLLTECADNGLVHGLEHKDCGHRGRDPAPHDLSGEDVDDEGHMDHALPA